MKLRSNQDKEAVNNAFIIVNSNDNVITSEDILPEFDINKVTCPRCRYRMENVKKLLQSKVNVDKRNMRGICDHCRAKQVQEQPCAMCQKIVKKFLNMSIGQEYVKAWLKQQQPELELVPHSHRQKAEEMYRFGKDRSKSTTADLPSGLDMKLKLILQPTTLRDHSETELFKPVLMPKKDPLIDKQPKLETKKDTPKIVEFPSDESVVTSFITAFSDVTVTKQRYKSFKYVFPKKEEVLAKPVVTTSSELIRETQDKIRKQKEEQRIREFALVFEENKKKIGDSVEYEKSYVKKDHSFSISPGKLSAPIITDSKAKIVKDKDKNERKEKVDRENIEKYDMPRKQKEREQMDDKKQTRLGKKSTLKTELDEGEKDPEELKDPKAQKRDDESLEKDAKEKRNNLLPHPPKKLPTNGDEGQYQIDQPEKDKEKLLTKEEKIQKQKEADARRRAKQEAPSGEAATTKFTKDQKQLMSKEDRIKKSHDESLRMGGKGKVNKPQPPRKPPSEGDKGQKQIDHPETDQEKVLTKEEKIQKQKEADTRRRAKQEENKSIQSPSEEAASSKSKKDQEKNINKKDARSDDEPLQMGGKGKINKPLPQPPRKPPSEGDKVQKQIDHPETDQEKVLTKEEKIQKQKEADTRRRAKQEENKSIQSPSEEAASAKSKKNQEKLINKKGARSNNEPLQMGGKGKINKPLPQPPRKPPSEGDKGQKQIDQPETDQEKVLTKEEKIETKQEKVLTKEEKIQKQKEAQDRRKAKQENKELGQTPAKEAAAIQEKEDIKEKEPPRPKEQGFDIMKIVPIKERGHEISTRTLEKQSREREAKVREIQEAALKAARLQAMESFKLPEVPGGEYCLFKLANKEKIPIEFERGFKPKKKLKHIDLKRLKIRGPSYDKLLLQMIKMAGKANMDQSESNTIKKGKYKIRSARRQFSVGSLSIDSDFELIIESFTNLHKLQKVRHKIRETEIVKNIPEKIKPKLQPDPIVFETVYNEANENLQIFNIEEFEEQPPVTDLAAAKGVIHYALSDRAFIDKGWTVLPTQKVVRKMNIYKIRPAHPEFDWFNNNKIKGLMEYETGERLAEFDEKGRGRWFYKNGRLALDYYESEETNAQQRFVIYSNGEPDERCRTLPVTILAMFDYLGNGVVFDHSGKIRVKYNQTEGVVLDRGIGPVSRWKWHTLNDPPVLQQVMIDTHVSHPDPDIMNMGGPGNNKPRNEDENMLAIELDNFLKEKTKKLTQKFQRFQIKMKALKLNENFALRILDQEHIYLHFRDGSTSLKLNLGMKLDHQEIIDTDTADVGKFMNSLEHYPPQTDSLLELQKHLRNARHNHRVCMGHGLRTRTTQPCASADRLVAALSKPLPPLLCATTSLCGCVATAQGKPSQVNLYYDTRLI